MSKLRSVLLVGFVALAPVSGAWGQATLFDSTFLRESCLQNRCEIALHRAVEQLLNSDIQADEFNSQLGAMAALLFEVARGADAEVALQVARGLLLLSQFSSDATQQNSLVQLANAIAEGRSDLFDLGQPFAVSPN